MSSVFADTVSRQTILRFRDPQHGESDESDLLLREAYEKFEAPDQEHNSSGNRSKFETTIRAWERFWKREIAGGAADREPTIGEIDRICLRNFRDAIRQKISPTSTNIYCGYVKQILRKCGPPDSRNPEGNRILSEVPYVRTVPVPRSHPDIVWMNQLGPWYEACRVATWPPSNGLPAPLWWRCVLVLCFTYGFRTTDVVQLNNSDAASRRKRSRPQGMDWSAIRDQAECPLGFVPYLNADGWIYLRPGKTETHKAELALPLTAAVRRHLDALPRPRCLDGEQRRLILPSPVCGAMFTEQNMKIQQAAGFQLKTDRRGRRQAMTPQMLRRSCRSYWGRISPEVATYVGGWSPRNVDDKHYLQPLAALLEEEHGERLIDRFRYPEAFLKGP